MGLFCWRFSSTPLPPSATRTKDGHSTFTGQRAEKSLGNANNNNNNNKNNDKNSSVDNHFETFILLSLFVSTTTTTPLSPKTGRQALAKIAAFSLEDWVGDVCGPIIRDLESSESYRSSGLDPHHRFGRHESIPPLRRCELYRKTKKKMIE